MTHSPYTATYLNLQTTRAVVLQEPRTLALQALSLPAAGADDVIVEVEWSGISTGTERLLWSGTMPPFPGMGYPLVPGYESVGRIVAAGAQCADRVGERVFVSGANCFGDIRGLFGGAASRLVVPQTKALRIADSLAEEGALMALAATALHAIEATPDARPPDLIIGHGVLGRLLARVTMARGAPAPVVWEINARRATGATGYTVVDPAQDTRRDYRSVYDVSGDAAILDKIMPHLAHGGEVVLAGFYSAPVTFAFPPAFMREARVRIAAEWQPQDLLGVRDLTERGELRLDGLITHRALASDAPDAYATAFNQPDCLKMILDWRDCR